MILNILLCALREFSWERYTSTQLFWCQKNQKFFRNFSHFQKIRVILIKKILCKKIFLGSILCKKFSIFQKKCSTLHICTYNYSIWPHFCKKSFSRDFAWSTGQASPRETPVLGKIPGLGQAPRFSEKSRIGVLLCYLGLFLEKMVIFGTKFYLQFSLKKHPQTLNLLFAISGGVKCRMRCVNSGQNNVLLLFTPLEYYPKMPQGNVKLKSF